MIYKSFDWGGHSSAWLQSQHLGRKGKGTKNLWPLNYAVSLRTAWAIWDPLSECMPPSKKSLKPSYSSSSVALNVSGVIWMNIHSLKIATYLMFNLVSWRIYQTYLQSIKVRLTDVRLHNGCTTTKSYPVMGDDMRLAYFHFLSACMTGICATAFAAGKSESLYLHRKLSNVL